MKKLFTFMFLLLGVVQSTYAQEPYAVLSEDNTTLTFYYDNNKEANNGMDVGPFSMEYIYTTWGYEVNSGWYKQRNNITTVVFDDSFADCSSITSTACWFYDCSKLSTIIGIEKLNTGNVTDMSYMFYYCSGLKSLDVSNFNTENVTSMWSMFSGCSSLTSLDVSNFNNDNVTNMTSMFSFCSGLTSLYLGNFNTENVENMSFMFQECSGLTSLYLVNFNTANVTNLGGMFYSCSGLTNLDVSNFNTANVTDMHSMFSGCTGLTSLDVSNFNTANVTYMYNMFYGCSSLTSLDVSNFNTDKVVNMEEMFYQCSNLTSLDVSNFNTANVTSMRGMFAGCTGLTSLDVSYFDIGNVKDMSSMFRSCTALTTIYCEEAWSCDNSDAMFSGCTSLNGAIDFDSDKTNAMYANPTDGYFTSTGKVILRPYAVLSDDNTTLTFYYDTNKKKNSGMSIGPFTYSSRWYKQREIITTVVFDNSFADCTSITSTAYWFSGCSNLSTIIGIENLNTDNVTDMGSMFYGCSGLTSLDVSNLNTDNVTDMGSMFYGCSGLTSLDVSNFNTANVTDMSSLFSGCSGLTSLDVSNFNTANVTNMSYMFSGCSGLTSLDVSNFNTANVTNLDGMFYSCSGLTSLDVSNFNTANVTNLDGMFYSCSGLTNLDVSKFNTANVTNMSYMFYQCSGLTTIYCNDEWKCGSSKLMFGGCNSLLGYFCFSPYYTDAKYASPIGGYFTPKGKAIVCPYAILSEDHTTLTFYYDSNKEANGGMVVGAFSENWNSVNHRREVNSGWYENRENITTVVFDDSFVDCTSIISTAYWFYDCSNLSTIIGIENFNTCNVTDMSYMFKGCSSLTNLDVSNFNTANVTNMEDMFNNCSGLTSLDVSNFNTANVRYLWGMFSDCSCLTSLDVSNFNTANVIYMSRMFDHCSNLTSLDVSNFNTENVKGMGGMFQFCSGLTSLDVSNFNTENVHDMGEMFSCCSGLTNLDVSNFNTENVTTMCGMFSACYGLTILDLSNFNTANMTDMRTMFISCENLTTIYVGNQWNTYNVTESYDMFSNCAKLTGGKGTVFDQSFIDVSYAHIDGGEENPGYLTDIADKVEYFSFTTSKGLTYTGIKGETTVSVKAATTELTGEVVIPETVLNNGSAYTVATIEPEAFVGCTKIEKMTIAKSVSEIGDNAFVGCTSLAAFEVTAGSEKFIVIDDVLYADEKTALVAYPAAKAGRYDMPKNVTAITDGAFAYAQLSSLTVESEEPIIVGSRTFEGMDFDNCVLNVPIGTTANYRAAEGWSQFKNIMGETVVIMEEAVYRVTETGGVALSSVEETKAVGEYVIPETINVNGVDMAVTEIAPSAFENCTGLTTITIPEGITSIGASAFKGCTGLEEIYCFSPVPIDLTRMFARRMIAMTREGVAITQFDGIDFETCILYVPYGTKDLYMNADGWKQFKHIVEMESNILGDANGDGVVDNNDIDVISRYIMTGETDGFIFKNADANGDGLVNVADIVDIINIKE